jgi:hypothetical protein
LVRLSLGLLLAGWACLTVNAQGQMLLSPRGAVWRYHNLNADLGTDWRAPDYDDSTWSSGAAPLGGGDPHIATAINIGPSGGRYPTIYFRRSFSVVSAADYEGLILRVLRDDGAAVYLNGTLLVADGVAIPSSHDQFATQIVDGANETTYFVYSAPATAMVDGVNVLAVEVKQANPTSSDLGFDLELEGLVDQTPPELLEVQPPPGTVVPSLDFIQVTFDEGITGIDADGSVGQRTTGHRTHLHFQPRVQLHIPTAGSRDWSRSPGRPTTASRMTVHWRIRSREETGPTRSTPRPWIVRTSSCPSSSRPTPTGSAMRTERVRTGSSSAISGRWRPVWTAGFSRTTRRIRRNGGFRTSTLESAITCWSGLRAKTGVTPRVRCTRTSSSVRLASIWRC